MHDAFSRGSSRAFSFGVGDVDRHAQIDLALAGMARLLPGFPVGIHQRRQLGDVAGARGDEDRMAELGHLA